MHGFSNSEIPLILFYVTSHTICIKNFNLNIVALFLTSEAIVTNTSSTLSPSFALASRNGICSWSANTWIINCKFVHRTYILNYLSSLIVDDFLINWFTLVANQQFFHTRTSESIYLLKPLFNICKGLLQCMMHAWKMENQDSLVLWHHTQ